VVEEEIEIPESTDFLASELFLGQLPRAHSEVLDFFSHKGVFAVADGAVLALHLESDL